jgi:hypothetical protein
MATKKLDVKELLKEVEALGRKVQEAGRAFVTNTSTTMRTAAEDTLDMAEDAIAAARKSLRKTAEKPEDGARRTTRKTGTGARRSGKKGSAAGKSEA